MKEVFKTRCSLNPLAAVMGLIALCGITLLAQTSTYHLGRTPTEDEIRAWDTAIGPEGKELPPGSGTAQEGGKIYAEKCAKCHGPTATEAKFYNGALVGGRGALNTPHRVRTIENFWAFATTVWDYISRAMPQGQEGSLSANEVYALTAFLLYRGNIIKESDVMDAKSLPKVPMPNRNGFVPARPDWKPGVAKPFGFEP